MPIPPVFAVTLVAAMSRCNTDVATQLQDQVRVYSTEHVTSAADLQTRVSDLANVILQAKAEDDIVSHVCPNDDDLTPVRSQLNAVRAWALEQQAEATQLSLASSCPASANAIAAGFLAGGWRSLVLATPANGSAAPTLVAKLTPIFQKEAQALQFELPLPADATDFWVKQTEDKGNAAAAACPAQQ